MQHQSNPLYSSSSGRRIGQWRGLSVLGQILSLCVGWLAVSSLAAQVILVTAEETIEAHADMVRMSVEVKKMGKDNAIKAKEEVDNISTQVAKMLIEDGVKPKDIISSALQIYPLESRYGQDKLNKHSGFVVLRKIDVVIRDLKLYSSIVHRLVAIGITRISNVQPDIADRDEMEQKALAQVAVKVKNKARFLAKQFGAKLGKVKRIGRHRAYADFGVLREHAKMSTQHMGANRKTGDNTSVSIQYDFKPAPVKIHANIEVEFELK